MAEIAQGPLLVIIRTLQLPSNFAPGAAGAGAYVAAASVRS
jgi:hypothetical protein